MQGRRLIDMRMISERPTEAVDRLQAGHREGDLILGAGNRSAIGTLIERQTRYLMLVDIPEGKPTAAVVCRGVADALDAWPAALRGTLSWDQGIELAPHRDITARTGAQVCFCDAHYPWQRAGNKSIDGLLRDCFPGGSDLRAIGATELARVACEADERPRKTPGWARPADLLAAQLLAAAQQLLCRARRSGRAARAGPYTTSVDANNRHYGPGHHKSHTRTGVSGQSYANLVDPGDLNAALSDYHNRLRQSHDGRLCGLT